MTHVRQSHNSDDSFPMNRNDFHVRSFKTPNSKGGTLQQHYITNMITSADVYLEMFQDIRLASDNDDIFIYFNSEGGMVDTGIQFVNVITESHGTVYTVLDGKAFSIAATMFLAGANKIVNACGSLMIHNFSAGVSGKGHELIQTIQGYNNYITDLMTQYNKPFLTEEEFDKVLDGKDLWFKALEIKDRLSVIADVEMHDQLIAEKEAMVNQIKMLQEQIEELDEMLEDTEEKEAA